MAVYNQRIMGPQHIINVVDYAVRTALTQRGPAHLAFPIDYQAAPADSGDRFRRNVPGHTSTTYRPPIRVPQRQDLEAAADKLAAPVIKAQLGKDCIPDDSPYTTGSIALVGTRMDISRAMLFLLCLVIVCTNDRHPHRHR